MKRTSIQFLFIIISLIILFAQLQSCGQHGLPKTEIIFPTGKTTVEVPFTRYRDWIIIPVQVNNSKTLSFIFDTGAPIGILTKADESINLSISGSIPVAGGDPNKPQTAPLAKGVTFKIGDLEIKNGLVAIGAASDVIAGTDGIIGKYLFENATVTVNWDSQKLIITRTDIFQQAGEAISIPLTMASTGHIYIDTDVSRNGRSVSIKSIIDTGAKSIFSMEKSEGLALLDEEPVLRNYIVGFGANGPQMGDMARGEVKIGNQQLSMVPITFKDSDGKPGSLSRNGIYGNVGLGILERFNLIFSLSENKLYLSPRSSINNPFITNRTGIITIPGNRKSIEVADVIPNSPANNLGIQPGDLITTVNGRNVESLNPHEVFILLKAEGETQVIISIERKGEKLNLTIPLKESI